MPFTVRPSRAFQRKAKELLKRYVSFKKELLELTLDLQENPRQGIGLGRNCYKIRLAIASKQKGKSGGTRIITYLLTEDEELILLTIYDKSQKANLSKGELDALLETFENEV